jgi:hypothetical protein
LNQGTEASNMMYGWSACPYNVINDHDVVMSEIPWLCAVVDGSTLPYGRLI